MKATTTRRTKYVRKPSVRAVDLFCGAGGASVSFRRAAQALGLSQELLAINHWPTAVATHRANHPDACHQCEAVDKVDPKTKEFIDPVTGVKFKPKGRVHLLMAGPECTHHSTARGGRPINDQSRTTAWQILKWLQEQYVDNVLIENVPEFREWGPLGANGRPMKSKKGHTYRAFLDSIRSLGYRVEDRILNAADYGDPTTRRRLFVIATRGNRPIQWPAPTHSRTGSATLFGKTKKWRAAREVIDWKLKGQSIFRRKRPLSPKTMARVIAGLERFGGAELKPFIIVLRNNMGGRSVDQPLPTISAGGQHMALAEPFVLVNNENNAPKSLDDPLGTVTGGNRHYLAEPFVMPVTHGSDSSKRERPVSEPLPTVTGANRGELALVEPFILQQQSGGVARPTTEPLPTIATDGAQMLVEPYLVGYHSEKGGEQKRVHGLDEPVPTVTTENRFAIVEPFIVSAGGPKVDARPVSEPMNTVLTHDHMALVEPFLVTMEHQGSTRDIEAPLPTITTAKGGAFAVVEPFFVPHYGERAGQTPRTHPVSEPVPTIPATGSGKFELCEAEVTDAFVASYYGTKNISPVDAPLPTVTTKDRFALVMPVVNGKALDIRLRMLKPHELAQAMSFGAEYQFAGNQGDQVKQIGNAWPCRLGQALIQTVLTSYAAKKGKRERAA